MKLIYKLLRLDPESREGIISATSVLGIAVNLLIAAVKVIVGLLASSIAIISEGVNNATDALTSVLALVGTKLAGKRPDEKHPFGYGRVEYLTSLVISILILVTGVEMLLSAVKLVFKPEALEISVISLVIVAASAVVKFVLGVYTIRMGKKADCGVLQAVGLDCRNDSFVSVLTIVSALLFLIFRLNIDAYIGIVTSLIIIKAGVDVLRETISELLGRRGDNELAAKLYKEIRSTEGILNAVDMMLHNYGPDAYSASCNVEIDHSLTVGEAYDVLHALQLRIMREYKVTMVFGIYAVDNDNENVRQIRETVAQFVRAHEHVISYHAIYMDKASDKLYCDLIVDYKEKDWDALTGEFTAYMKEYYPDRQLVLTVETEYV